MPPETPAVNVDRVRPDQTGAMLRHGPETVGDFRVKAFAEWLVANKDRKGSPEFTKVAEAFKLLRQPAAPRVPEGKSVGREFAEGVHRGMAYGLSPFEGAEPSFAGTVGEVVGGTIGPTGALGATARFTTKLTGKVSRYIEPVIDQFRTAPLKTALIELGVIAPTAGVLGAGGEAVGGETGQMVGEMAGGVVGAGGAVAGELAGKAVRRGVQETVSGLGLTSAARERAATDILRKNMGRPETEDAIMTGEGYPAFGKPTTGEFANDPGLLSLQRVIARREAGGVARSQDIRSDQNQSLREGMRGLDGAEGGDTSFFARRLRASVAKIEDRVVSALGTARQQWQATTGGGSLPAVQARARTRLDETLAVANQEERRIWGEIGDGMFTVQNVRDRARDIVDNRPRWESDQVTHPLIYRLAGDEYVEKIPTGLVDEFGQPIVREALQQKGGLKPVETLEEITALRSQITEIVRAENARGNYARSRKLKLILEELSNITPRDTSSAEAMTRAEAARRFSRSKNDVFTHEDSPVATILGYSSKGGLRTAPELTFERILGEGTPGLLGARSFMNAETLAAQSGGMEPGQAQQLMREYLVGKFSRAVHDESTDTFNEAAARAFVKNNDDFLREMFPDLRQQMLEASAGERLARSVDKAGRARIAGIENKSVLARYMGVEDPTPAVNSIIGSKTALRDLRSLINTAKKDPGGKALDGLKTSFYDSMMARVAGAGEDAAGERMVSAPKLRDFLARNAPLVRELYGKEGESLLREVEKGARMAARLQTTGKAAGGGSDTAENLQRIGGTLGLVIGGRLAQVAGAHSLLIAGTARRIGARAVKPITDAKADDVLGMVEHALRDPQFARTLLENYTPRNATRINARLRGYGWLLGEGGDAVGDMTDGGE